MAGSSSDRPVLEVSVTHKQKAYLLRSLPALPRRAQGASYQPAQRPVLCTAAPLCTGCHRCLPSHSVWMSKSRCGKWVQSLCSSNRLDEWWHHDQGGKKENSYGSAMVRAGPRRPSERWGQGHLRFTVLIPSASGSRLFCSASINAAFPC